MIDSPSQLPRIEQITDANHDAVQCRSHRIARWVGGALLTTTVGLAIGGGVAAFETDAHLQIAGSNATVGLRWGESYDQVNFDGALGGKKATSRTLPYISEPIGAAVQIDLDTKPFIAKDGSLDLRLLPEYIQLYSDPKQIVSDIEGAETEHIIKGGAFGALIGLALAGSAFGRNSYRRKHDAKKGITAESRQQMSSVDQTFYRRIAVALVVAATLNGTAAASPTALTEAAVVGNPLLVGTPLEGTEVDGLLAPFIQSIDNIITTYATDTNEYYEALDQKTQEFLDKSQLTLPDNSDTVSFGFVTDRHCNTGMDRTIVTVMKHFGIKTIVSGGDDAFNGSFAIESGCTSNLAEKSKQAGISIVSVGGNHDSPMTLQDQVKQGINVLDNKIVRINGIDFLGSADPRTSRWDQGIVPASQQAQDVLTTAQGTELAKVACASDGDIFLVAHDSNAGDTAIKYGCGTIVLALDGHTHRQSTQYVAGARQFTGNSAGGAPSETSTDSTNILDRITVGPLQHPATVYITSINKVTQVFTETSFTFQPDQTMQVQQTNLLPTP